MKTRLLAFLILPLLALSCAARDVIFNLEDMIGTPGQTVNLMLRLTTAPMVRGNAMVLGGWKTFTTDTNGYLLITNLFAGTNVFYEAQARCGASSAHWYIYVRDGYNGVDQDTLWVTAPNTSAAAYAAQASDQRYPIHAGSNIVPTTNATTGEITWTATLIGGAASLGDITNTVQAMALGGVVQGSNILFEVHTTNGYTWVTIHSTATGTGGSNITDYVKNLNGSSTNQAIYGTSGLFSSGNITRLYHDNGEGIYVYDATGLNQWFFSTNDRPDRVLRGQDIGVVLPPSGTTNTLLRGKKLAQGANVTITEGATDITIAASGTGGSGSYESVAAGPGVEISTNSVGGTNVFTPSVTTMSNSLYTVSSNVAQSLVNSGSNSLYTTSSNVAQALVNSGTNALYTTSSNIAQALANAASNSLYTVSSNIAQAKANAASNSLYTVSSNVSQSLVNNGSNSLYTVSSNIAQALINSGTNALYTISSNISQAIANGGSNSLYTIASNIAVALSGVRQYGSVWLTNASTNSAFTNALISGFSGSGQGAANTLQFDGPTNGTSRILKAADATVTLTLSDSNLLIGTSLASFTNQYLANVKTLGAKGDGATIDDAAFAAAFTNPAVYIPAGTYVLSNTLNLTNMHIWGDGPGLSILKMSTGWTGILLFGGSNSVTIENLGLDGAETSNFLAHSKLGTRAGIKVYAGNNSTVKDVRIYNFSSNALAFDGYKADQFHANEGQAFNVCVTNCIGGIYSDLQLRAGISINSCKIGRCFYGIKVGQQASVYNNFLGGCTNSIWFEGDYDQADHGGMIIGNTSWGAWMHLMVTNVNESCTIVGNNFDGPATGTGRLKFARVGQLGFLNNYLRLSLSDVPQIECTNASGLLSGNITDVSYAATNVGASLRIYENWAKGNRTSTPGSVGIYNVALTADPQYYMAATAFDSGIYATIARPNSSISAMAFYASNMQTFANSDGYGSPGALFQQWPGNTVDLLQAWETNYGAVIFGVTTNGTAYGNKFQATNVVATNGYFGALNVSTQNVGTLNLTNPLSAALGGTGTNNSGASDGQGLYWNVAASAFMPSNNPAGGSGSSNMVVATINNLQSSVVTVTNTVTASNFVATSTGTNYASNTLIITTGGLGVSTNGPQALVDIQGTNGGNGYLFRVGSLNMANGTNIFAVNTNGNVMIGTNAANAAFHVTADNSMYYITQIGTSNRPTAFLINSNGQISLGTTNDVKGWISLGLTNGSGITNQYAFSITSNGVTHFTVDTNGVIGNRANIACGGQLGVGSFLTASAYINFAGSSANSPRLRGVSSGLGAALLLEGGAGVGSSSNNLWVSGQVCASNGVIARVHTQYSTNIVPLLVQPQIGQTNDFLQVQGTNGNSILAVDSNACLRVSGFQFNKATTNISSANAITNIAVDFFNSRVTIFATNAFTLTNFVNMGTGEGTEERTLEMFIVGCSNAMPVVTLPTLGGSQFGVRIWTNQLMPVVTLQTFTNLTRTLYLWRATGTNIYLDARCYQ